MRGVIYGNRMLVVDLVLVSLWGLFFSRFCSEVLLLFIPIRIALAFEMRRRSPWTLVSALGFLIGFSSTGYVAKPIESMVYYFCCAVGESDWAVRAFSDHVGSDLRVSLQIVATLWYVWIAIMPLAVGVLFRNLNAIQWKRKWIWIYLAPMTCLSVWVMITEGVEGGILWGLVLAFLPVVYWCVYVRGDRSPIQLILDDRRVMWYVWYGMFMLAAFIIGVRDIYSLKFVGLLLLPPVFYIMLTRSLHLGTVLTRCCLALWIAGLLYWLTFSAPKWVAVGLLVLAIALIVFVGIEMRMRTRRWGVSLVLVVSIPLAIIPMILGLNPYVCLDTDHTRLYIGNPVARNGVYVVQKYTEDGEEGTPYYWGIKYGLRDRYGMILEPEYTDFMGLGYSGRYVAVNKPVGKGCLIKDQRYGIFDLRERKFVVDSKDTAVSEIERIDDVSYKLINPEGIHFATLYLSGMYDGKYYYEAHVERGE